MSDSPRLDPATIATRAQTLLDAGDYLAVVELMQGREVPPRVESRQHWLLMRGVANNATDNLAAAEADYRLALGEALDTALACWKNLGGLMLGQQRWREAQGGLENYLLFRPRESEAVILYASAQAGSTDFSGAIETLDHYLECFPEDRQARIFRSDYRVRCKDYWWGLLDASALQKRCPEPDAELAALHVFGYSLLGLSRTVDCVISRHLSAGGSMTLLLADALGGHLLLRGKYAEAIACLRPWINHPEAGPEIKLNYALALLSCGDYREGLRLFMVRKNVIHMNALPGVPEWNGEPLSGCRVLIHWEQGLGDSILFMRFLPMLASRNVRPVFSAQTAILPLLKSAGELPDDVETSTCSSSFNYQMHLADLPLVCGLDSPSGIPSTPYIEPEPARVAHWQERLSTLKGLRVGLAWAGNPGQGTDHSRSMSLAELMPLAAVPGVSFVSLQLGKSGDELDQYRDELPMLDLRDELPDLGETAALIKNLDIVISTCTMISHLAGAMGKPVWVMLPCYGTYWVWGLEQDRSPWYPSARLFRQQRIGCWRDVVHGVRSALCQESMERNSQRLEWVAVYGQLSGQNFEGAGVEAWLANLQEDDLQWVSALVKEMGNAVLERNKLLEGLRVRFPDSSRVQVLSACFAEGDVAAVDPLWAYLERLGKLGAADWRIWIERKIVENRFAEALSLLERARHDFPADSRLKIQEGRCWVALGHRDRAIASFEDVVANEPRPVETSLLLATELLSANRFREAHFAVQRALLFNPLHPRTRILAATLAIREGYPDLGVDVLSSDELGALSLTERLKLAECFAYAGFEEGAADFLAGIGVLDMRGTDRVIYANTLLILGRLDEHEAVLREGVARAELSDAPFRLATCLLAKGLDAEGWALYRKSMSKPSKAVAPRWNGEELRGKRLLVYQDQGFGDLIQFFPLIKEVAKQAASVTLAVIGSIRALLDYQQSPGVYVVSLNDDVLNDSSFDFHVPQMDLPDLLACELRLPRHQQPILRAPEGVLARWERELSATDGLKVGVVWAGNPSYANDAFRSTLLADWKCLVDLEGIVWCSLQKDAPSNQAYSAPGFHFRNLGADCDDWAKTACVISNLDLVVSIDTGVAHLAAALGVPTWILLPSIARDFRWGLDGEDCPWYPSVRLFRQEMEEEWSDVLARVRVCLQALSQTENGPE